MAYDYFIATRWQNREDVLDLTRRLREKGKSVYCFIEDDDGGHRQYDPAFKQLALTDPAVVADFERDMEALRDSAALIFLLPAGKSSHIEAGAAYGLGRPCILIGVPTETDGMYHIFGQRYKTIEDFLEGVH